MATTTSRGGRRAVVPDIALIPSRVDETGLCVRVTHEDGTGSAVLDASGYPGSLRLRQQFIAAIALRNGPGGPLKRVASCRTEFETGKAFLAWCEAQGIESWADLTAQDWQDWKSDVEDRDLTAGSKDSMVGVAKRLLLACDLLSEGTRDVVEERYSHSDDGDETDGSERFYELDEYEALRDSAYRQLWSTNSRIARNWSLASTPRDAVSAGNMLRWQALRSLLIHGQPQSRDEFRALGAMSKGEPLLTVARSSLFLSTDEVIAAGTALMAETGENLSTLQERVVPSTVATSGDEDIDVLQSYLDKPRRGPRRRYMIENLDADTPAGRIMELVISATEPARVARRWRGEPDSDRLLIYVTVTSALRHDLRAARNVLYKVDSRWLPEDVEHSFAKLHRTVLTRVKARSTHNTEPTYLEAYASDDPRMKDRWGLAAAEGVQALFDIAREHVVRLVSEEESANLPSDAGTHLTPTGMMCVDCDHNPRTGKPCSDPWLACLGCSNAYATPAHLPLLVYCWDLLEQLRTTTEPARWENRYALAWARLTLVLEPLNEAQWEQARAERTDVTERLVRGAIMSREYEL